MLDDNAEAIIYVTLDNSPTVPSDVFWASIDEAVFDGRVLPPVAQPVEVSDTDSRED